MSGVGSLGSNPYANISQGKVQEKINNPIKNADSNGGKSIETKPADAKSQKAAADSNIQNSSVRQTISSATSSTPDQKNVNASVEQNKASNTGQVYSAGGAGKDRAEAQLAFQQKGNVKTGASDTTGVTDRSHTSHEHDPGKDDDRKIAEQRPGRGSVTAKDYKFNRRGRPYDEEESEEDASRRRRKQATFLQQQPKKPLTILEGARVGESQTQDMFVSSSITAERISGKVSRSIVDQIKEYDLGPIGCNVYDAVYANSNGNEKNGIGPNMQKDLFAEIMKGIAEVDDVMSPEYRRLVRDVVQGAMEAGQETRIDLKDIVKMLVSGFMAMSPHDDDPKIMVEAIKHIVSEVMYGKINIGYNMKSAAYYLGAALHTLQLYYKNYQKDIEYTKELEQKINSAFSENVWKATGEISNYSQVYAKTNIEQFMAGKLDEEKAYNKNVVKDLVFSPLKRVFNKT